MATAAKVLDVSRFESRARIADILAIGVALVVGFSLMIEMYYLGYSSVQALGDPNMVYERDAKFLRVIVQAGIFVASFGWIVYRVLSGSARRVGG